MVRKQDVPHECSFLNRQPGSQDDGVQKLFPIPPEGPLEEGKKDVKSAAFSGIRWNDSEDISEKALQCGARTVWYQFCPHDDAGCGAGCLRE